MRNTFAFFLGVLLFVSCDSGVVFDAYQSIPENEWHKEHKLQFSFNPQDSLSINNVFIKIRNNKEYEFSTLFLITDIGFPSGYHVVDTLEYEMTDAEGKWLGTGFTDIKENKLFYKEKVRFTEKGVYIINIEQATRKMSDVEGKLPLKGITDVGLRIEKEKQE